MSGVFIKESLTNIYNRYIIMMRSSYEEIFNDFCSILTSLKIIKYNQRRFLTLEIFCWWFCMKLNRTVSYFLNFFVTILHVMEKNVNMLRFFIHTIRPLFDNFNDQSRFAYKRTTVAQQQQFFPLLSIG